MEIFKNYGSILFNQQKRANAFMLRQCIDPNPYF
jgi:hypothetical protein